ncbi:methyltransferase, partial [Pontibacter sp. HJ8]
AFNLNLLHHINRELGGNFDVSKFRHFALYEPQEGVMKSYLISQETQEVYLESTDQRFLFEAWEAVHTENSYKYTLKQVKQMGKSCGFEVEEVFLDERGYFADVLFTVA